MGRFQIPHLPFIRSQSPEMYKALRAVEDAINSHSDQGNLDPTSTQAASPSPISGFTVTEKGGIHDVAITDNTKAYRGVNYFAEYSQDQTNWHKIDLGASQNHRANLGAGQYYWRGYSSYPTSGATAPVYHGGATPAVVGSGTYPGPDMSTRQGGMGFGPVYRNSSTPPVRQ